MARQETQKMGSIPLHTLDADVDYAVSTAYTTYGTIGIKVWIYRGKFGEQAETVSVRRPRPSRGAGAPGRGGRGHGGRKRSKAGKTSAAAKRTEAASEAAPAKEEQKGGDAAESTG
jgi:small subunit ribosomal protein S3